VFRLYLLNALEEIKEAVENVTLAKHGKLKAKPLNELLNEL